MRRTVAKPRGSVKLTAEPLPYFTACQENDLSVHKAQYSAHYRNHEECIESTYSMPIAVGG
jgi:hypothetical protein